MTAVSWLLLHEYLTMAVYDQALTIVSAVALLFAMFVLLHSQQLTSGVQLSKCVFVYSPGFMGLKCVRVARRAAMACVFVSAGRTLPNSSMTSWKCLHMSSWWCSDSPLNLIIS